MIDQPHRVWKQPYLWQQWGILDNILKCDLANWWEWRKLLVVKFVRGVKNDIISKLEVMANTCASSRGNTW